jgi:hypothetical protein
MIRMMRSRHLSLDEFDGVLGLQLVQHLMCNIGAQGAMKYPKNTIKFKILVW